MRRGEALGAMLCGLAATFPRPAAAADPLRVATIPLDAGAEVYYALDSGFFRDAGIDAQIQSIPNGAAIASAVASNALDVGFSNLISIGEAYQRNVPFTVIAPGSLWSVKAPTTVLMVPKGSAVHSARDLNGKTFGINGLKNILQYGAQAWMDKNGGDSSGARFVEMTFPQTVEALRAGRIDAGMVAEPFIEAVKGEARILAPALDAVAPNLLIGCWFTTKAWAAAHPDLVARFSLVIEKTAAWANAHQKASGPILMKYGKLDPQTLGSMLRVVYATHFDATQMQPVLDVAARYGGLTSSFPVSELVYR